MSIEGKPNKSKPVLLEAKEGDSFIVSAIKALYNKNGNLKEILRSFKAEIEAGPGGGAEHKKEYKRIEKQLMQELAEAEHKK